MFTPAQLQLALSRAIGRNLPTCRVVSVEQTTNYGGGAIWDLAHLNEVCHLAHRQGLLTHMDGARLWHAVTATGIPAATYAQHFDAVWVDFSKGLGAPMGAVLAGSKAFIEEAWYYKFQQGGGMHQAGIIAAGCLYGLQHHRARLEEIHALTKQLAQGLATLPCIDIDPGHVVTNIIIFSVAHPLMDAYALAKALLARSIRVLAFTPSQVRMILHLDISMRDVQHTIATFKQILTST
ncbi:MAG: beta-eliminating lyase-related protein [Roseivirga sp.]